jgi:hypothetical protein
LPPTPAQPSCSTARRQRSASSRGRWHTAGEGTRAKLHAPTLIIVGNVVRLREKLGWFEPKPEKESIVRSRCEKSRLGNREHREHRP